MKANNLTYYNWDDIKLEICKEMDISENYFRDYHKLIGGEYKDLWHAWLDLFDPEVSNEAINFVDCEEDMDLKIEGVKEAGKDWLEPFIRAVYKVWETYRIENVRYYW